MRRENAPGLKPNCDAAFLKLRVRAATMKASIAAHGGERRFIYRVPLRLARKPTRLLAESLTFCDAHYVISMSDKYEIYLTALKSPRSYVDTPSPISTV